MRTSRTIATIAIAGLLLAGCGEDDPVIEDPPADAGDNGAEDDADDADTDDGPAADDSGADDTATDDAADDSEDGSDASDDSDGDTDGSDDGSADGEGLAQPALWPAADVVFDSPEAAADDFVATVFEATGVEFGEFQAGDQRSGEIVVYFTGESGDRQIERSRLPLRQIVGSDGWFVVGAVNNNATIAVPENNAEVAAGPVTVEGVARGFEANVVVTAFIAGDADAVLDEQVTMGGAFADPEPYSVELDLSGANPGDMVAVVVRGGTGTSADTGDFGAITLVVN